MAPLRPRCRGGHRTATAVQLNRKICEAAEAEGVEGVLKLCGKSSASLVNLSTALHRIAVLSSRQGEDVGLLCEPEVAASLHDERVVCLQKRAAASLHDERVVCLQKRVHQQLLDLNKGKELTVYARCLSTVAWSMMKLDILDKELMLTICELSVDCMQAFKPVELANLLWSITKARLESPLLFQRAMEQVARTMGQYTVRSLSMVSWACAVQKCPMPAEMLADVAATFLRCYSCTTDYVAPVVVVNMAWALAALGFKGSKACVLLLAGCVHEMVDKFKHDELSITLWAFASLGVFSAEVFGAAARRLRTVGMKQRLQAQGLANVLWSFAKYSQAPEAPKGAPELAAHVFVELQPVYRRLANELQPLELSAIIWATAIVAPFCTKQDHAMFIMVSAASGPNAHPNVVSKMSRAGAVSMLSAYVRFFQASGAKTPNTVSSLMIRLMHHCRMLGLMLRKEDDVLAYQEQADPTTDSWKCEDVKREADDKLVRQGLQLEANDRAKEIPSRNLEDERKHDANLGRQRLHEAVHGNPRAFCRLADCTAAAHSTNPSSDDEDFEPAFVLGELAATQHTVASAEAMPMFITSSDFASSVWALMPNLSVTVEGMQDVHLCVMPGLSRCGTDGGDIEIAFRASSRCPEVFVQVCSVVQGCTELLFRKDVFDEAGMKVLILRVKPHEGAWTLHLSLVSRVARLASIDLPFIGRIPRLFPVEGDETRAGPVAKPLHASDTYSTRPSQSVCSRSTCEGVSDSSECGTPSVQRGFRASV